MLGRAINRVFIAIAGTILGLLLLLISSSAHASPWIGIPPWEYQRDISITQQLTLSDATPDVGQVVSAEFTIRNHSQNTVTFNQIGVAARGPNCYNLSCGNATDFPIHGYITLQPGQTFTYSNQRSFARAGDHFAQLAFQAPNGNWYSLDSARNFTVQSAAAQPSQAVRLTATDYTVNDIVYAEFELYNDTSQTLYYKKIGVGVRHSNGSIADFPYDENVTIRPGESHRFRQWQQFVTADTYKIQIATLDGSNRWDFHGAQTQLTIKQEPYAPRRSPWRMSAHYHPVWNDNDSTRLALAKSVGIDLLRVAVEWQRLQPDNANSYDAWYSEVLAAFLQRAQDEGISVYLMVSGSPCWAAADAAKQCAWQQWDRSAPPANPSDYANVMAELVRRHGHQVVAWEIWNEPNIGRFWTNPNSAEYTRLLAAASQAIKAQQWNATVLGGAIAGTDHAFLLGMYANGAAQHYDALSIHPYAGTRSPNDCTLYMSSFHCGVEGMRALMLHNNDYKPMWFSEFGWSSFGGHGGVGEYKQTEYLQKSIARIQQWDFVAVATWYNLVDTSFDQSAAQHEHQMGLFRENNQPKSAAYWLRNNPQP